MSAFYASSGDLHQTLRRLVERLRKEGIPHAVIGGMALAAHGLVRATEGVDVLLTHEGLDAFRARCVGRGYVPAFPGAAKVFRDTETGVRVEFITSGEYPGDGRSTAVSFPEPEASAVEIGGIPAITLEKLVELKLASGMSAPGRLRDLADVQDLIRALALPESFSERLDASVQERYRELWQAVQDDAEP
jgi:hypothetical protein